MRVKEHYNILTTGIAYLPKWGVKSGKHCCHEKAMSQQTVLGSDHGVFLDMCKGHLE